MPRRLGPFALAVLTLLAARGQGDDATAKKLTEAGQTFAKKWDQAKAKVVADLDRAEALTRKARGLTGAARTDKLAELAAARKRFLADGVLPPDDDYTEIELRYYLAVNQGFVPLAKVANEVIEAGTKAGDQELTDRGLKMRAKLEAQLPGATRLTANSAWRGTFRRGGATIPYHLYVGKKGAGGSFKGHVEDNPGVAGNWAYDVDGQTSGLGVEFVLSKSVRGSFSAVRVVGIVSGDRLIAEVAQTVGRGKPATGLLVLNRGR